MPELKRLRPESVEAALTKAERYRLLNEPWHAESICRDVLTIDPKNQHAIVMLVLALTDQFGTTVGKGFQESRGLVAKLESEYERVYYEGIICERRGKAYFERRQPGAGHLAHEWYAKAMEAFEQAEKLQPPRTEDAKLRWNTCARMLMTHDSIKRDEYEAGPQLLE